MGHTLVLTKNKARSYKFKDDRSVYRRFGRYNKVEQFLNT